MPSHDGLATNDGDRSHHIGLDVVERRENESAPTIEPWPMSQLTLKHGYLMVERYQIRPQ
jgi:hypothetical protein